MYRIDAKPVRRRTPSPSPVNPPAESARGTGDSPGIVRSAIDRQRVCSLPARPRHDRYLAQFQWVRSYVMEGGHLLLETMADGSIVEFEPTAGAAGN